MNDTATEPVPPTTPIVTMTMSAPTPRPTPPYDRPAPTELPSTANCWPGMPLTVSVTATPGVTAVLDEVSVGCASAASVDRHVATRAPTAERIIRMNASTQRLRVRRGGSYRKAENGGQAGQADWAKRRR